MAASVSRSSPEESSVSSRSSTCANDDFTPCENSSEPRFKPAIVVFTCTAPAPVLDPAGAVAHDSASVTDHLARHTGRVTDPTDADPPAPMTVEMTDILVVGAGPAGIRRRRTRRPRWARRNTAGHGGLPARQDLRGRTHPRPSPRCSISVSAVFSPTAPYHRTAPTAGARAARPVAGQAVRRLRQRGDPGRARRGDPRDRPGSRSDDADGIQSRRRRMGRCPCRRRHRRRSRRSAGNQSVDSDRRRRRALWPGQGPGPPVAPRHRIRRRRTGLRRLGPVRRRVDGLAPGAARCRRDAAAGLRLGVPAGPRPAQRRRQALATAKRPAHVELRPTLRHYAEMVRDEWAIDGEPQRLTSALLPMGGAVSGVAGPNGC